MIEVRSVDSSLLIASPKKKNRKHKHLLLNFNDNPAKKESVLTAPYY